MAQLMQTEGLDLRTFLEGNELKHITTKLVDDSKLNIDHLINCKENDIRQICIDLQVNSIDTIKLITAIRQLPNALINVKSENKIVFIGKEENKILQELHTKKKILSERIERAQSSMQNITKCTDQINDKCDKMIAQIESHRAFLLKDVTDFQSIQQNKLNDTVKQHENITKYIDEYTQTTPGSNAFSQQIDIHFDEKLVFIYDDLSLNLDKNLKTMKIEICTEDYFGEETKKESDENETNGVNFSGLWQLKEHKNFNNYLHDEGYNLAHRKLAKTINSAVKIVHDKHLIHMNAKQTMGLSLQEDDDHGNLNSVWILDGKTYSIEGDTGHNVQKTAMWNDDKSKAIGTSYDTKTEIKMIYELYLNENDQLCLKRTNKRDVYMTQIYSKTSSN